MTRAQVQANRIRGLTAHEGSSLRQLHTELCRRGVDVGVYETFRRRMAPHPYGTDQNGSSYHVLKGIADVYDVPIEWIAGDDGIELAIFTRGVYVSSEPDCSKSADCPLYAGDGGPCLRGVACRNYTAPVAVEVAA